VLETLHQANHTDACFISGLFESQPICTKSQSGERSGAAASHDKDLGETGSSKRESGCIFWVHKVSNNVNRRATVAFNSNN
jgi:hypothetical protein